MDDGNESQNGINTSTDKSWNLKSRVVVQPGSSFLMLLLTCLRVCFNCLRSSFNWAKSARIGTAAAAAPAAPAGAATIGAAAGPAAIDVAGSDMLLVMVLSTKTSAEVHIRCPAASRSWNVRNESFKVAMFESSKQFSRRQITGSILWSTIAIYQNNVQWFWCI